MGPAEFITALRKGNLDAAYFFRGPDRFLHQECREAVRASVPEESRSWCLTEVEYEPGLLERELQAARRLSVVAVVVLAQALGERWLPLMREQLVEGSLDIAHRLRLASGERHHGGHGEQAWQEAAFRDHFSGTGGAPGPTHRRVR